jgi:hypothetical protein
MLTLWFAVGLLAGQGEVIETPAPDPLRSFVWGIEQGRYEDPDRVIAPKPRPATTKEKRKATLKALEEILGMLPNSPISEEATKAIAAAAQAELEAQNLKTKIADLEAMIAKRVQMFLAYEEKRRKRNAALTVLLLAS